MVVILVDIGKSYGRIVNPKVRKNGLHIYRKRS